MYLPTGSMHDGTGVTSNTFLFPEFHSKIELNAQDGVDLFLFNSNVKVTKQHLCCVTYSNLVKYL